MTLKTLKNMNERVWRRIKAHAAMHNVSMSEMISKMAEEHMSKHKGKTGWDIVLSGERTLTEEESESLNKVSKEMRKSFSLRV